MRVLAYFAVVYKQNIWCFKLFAEEYCVTDLFIVILRMRTTKPKNGMQRSERRDLEREENTNCK